MNVYAMKKPSKINGVTVVMFLLLTGFIYGVWTFIPVIWPLWQVTNEMRVACASAMRTDDDEEVIKLLLKNTQRTRLKLSADNFQLTRIPYEPEELESKSPEAADRFRKIGRECLLEFYYDDTYLMPIIKREFRMPYQSEIRLDLVKNTAQKNLLNEWAYNSCTCTAVRRGSSPQEGR